MYGSRRPPGCSCACRLPGAARGAAQLRLVKRARIASASLTPQSTVTPVPQATTLVRKGACRLVARADLSPVQTCRPCQLLPCQLPCSRLAPACGAPHTRAPTEWSLCSAPRWPQTVATGAESVSLRRQTRRDHTTTCRQGPAPRPQPATHAHTTPQHTCT